LRNVIVLALLLLPAAVLADDIEVDHPLEIHFGGDVGFGKRFGDSSQPSAFRVGVIDTMIHGHLSRTFSALAEVVYEAADNGGFGFDVERLVLNFTPRAWFSISAGRFHSPLGYWNTAYHHARWMYASIEAPLLARFEDGQGPLPTHTIGVLVHGMVPAGDLRFEYDVAVGNGRGPQADPPQQFADNNEGKSLIAGLHVGIAGLRVGLSGMIDATTLSTGLDMQEQLAVADVHWTRESLEAIAEGALIRHDFGTQVAVNAGATSSSPGACETITEEGTRGIAANLTRVRASGESIRELGTITTDNARMVREIASAVSQQNAGIGQIFSAVRDLSTSMTDLMRLIDESTASVRQVARVSDQIVGIVGSFRL
jgi:hypothetical protein